MLNIIFWIMVLILAGVFISKKESNAPEAVKAREQASQQETPEGALALYLQVAYKFMHNEPGGKFPDVQRSVTKDDWAWYQKNKNNIDSDPLSLKSGIDPTVAGAATNILALHILLSVGPNRPDNKTIKTQDNSDHVIFTVRKEDGFGGHDDFDVRVVKEDNLWKVSGFAGGRAAYSN